MSSSPQPITVNEFPAYGQQRGMVLLSDLDDDGFLRTNVSEPVWNVLRIDGPVDTARLAQAVAAVTESVDSLHVRLRDTEQGPIVVFDKPRPFELEVIDVERVTQDGRLSPEAAAALAPRLFDKIDLQQSPTGRICLLTAGQFGNLLTFSFDHSTLDGWSLGLLTKSIAQSYRSGTAPRTQARGFREYLLSLPDAAAQERHLTGWKELLAEHPPPGMQLHFPGGISKPDGNFLINGHFETSLHFPTGTQMATAVGQLELTRAELLAAVAGLAVNKWASGPQPLLGLRHGRHRREDTLVMGPLVEPYVSLPPGAQPRTVGEWLTSHRTANQHTPPLYGRSIREVGALGPRNVAFNVIPPARPVPFGSSLKGETATQEYLAPLWAGGRPSVPSTAAMWVNFYMDRPGELDVLITHDQDVIPDPGIFVETMRRVIALAAQSPDIELAVALTHI
ncbi:condensation domain-containing protein [Streptomyces buecherae]|uniref:condensation domain-containing protein n=1 Tax=Streptomyces buecherae TaxID=2763006 RepID=UPI00340DE6C4